MLKNLFIVMNIAEAFQMVNSLKACIPGGSSVPIFPANLLLKQLKVKRGYEL